MASAVKPPRIGFRGDEAPLLAIPELRRRHVRPGGRRSVALQENLPINNARQSAAQSKIEYLLQKLSILEFSVWSGRETRQNSQILVEI
jgi:hypothetical protein